MARPRSAKTFPSALVPFVLALVRMGGKDARRLEKKYLRATPPVGQALPEISIDDLNGLLAAAAKELDDPLFGLHAALAMPRGTYGLLEFALRSAPTGRKAIEQLSKFGALINPLVRWSLEVDGDEVALHHRAPKEGGVGRQGNYFTVARILEISRQMMGSDLMPTRAWFAHDEQGCPPELQAHLGSARVSFGRTSNGIAFPTALLERVPEGSDPELNAVLEAHASALLVGAEDGADLHQRARRTVAALLPGGEVSLAKVAKKLHLSARTLQRKLTGEGVAFAQLVNEVRKEQAQRLLEQDEVSLDVIARRLGYTELGAFVRAFRRWTGTTPGKYREAGLA